jgi:hypothetical protein
MGDKYIGRRATKKHGYFSGLIGVVHANDFITPYKIVFSDGSSVGVSVKDIELIEDKKDGDRV